MILEGILNAFAALLKALFGFINLPQLPDVVTTVLDTLISYMNQSLGIVSLVVDWNVAKPILAVVVAFNAFDMIYKLVLFVLKKIPFFGIE